MEETQELLVQVIKAMVAHPDEVEVHASEDKDERGEFTTMNVKVHPEDVGLCIGEGGKTAEAFRRIFGLIGHRHEQRLYVRIDAPKIPRAHFYQEE